MDKKHALSPLLFVAIALGLTALLGGTPYAERAERLLSILASWQVVTLTLVFLLLSSLDLQGVVEDVFRRRDISFRLGPGEATIQGGGASIEDDGEGRQSPAPEELPESESRRIAEIAADQVPKGELEKETRHKVGWMFEYANLALAPATRAVLHWIADIGRSFSYAEYADRFGSRHSTSELETMLEVLARVQFVREAPEGEFKITDLGKEFLQYKPSWEDIRPVSRDSAFPDLVVSISSDDADDVSKFASELMTRFAAKGAASEDGPGGPEGYIHIFSPRRRVPFRSVLRLGKAFNVDVHSVKVISPTR